MGEWPNALVAICLCGLQSTNRRGLFATYRDTALLLRSRLLRRETCFGWKEIRDVQKAFLIPFASAILATGVFAPTSTLAQLPGSPPLPGPAGPPSQARPSPG